MNNTFNKTVLFPGTNTKITAISGRFTRVEDCVINDNDIGIRSYEGTFKRNMISANEIGYYFPSSSDSYFPTMSDNNICGNTLWNIQYMGHEDWYTTGNWFGSRYEALLIFSDIKHFNISETWCQGDKDFEIIKSTGVKQHINSSVLIIFQ